VPKKANQEKGKNSVAAGVHYELPGGKIAYTYGFDDTKKTVMYRFDDDKGGRTADYATVKAWKPRPDLKDFPNARDPRMPYYFDLVWDLKYTSDVRAALDSGHDESEKIRAALREHGIVL
jgi:hypothetical protein